LSDAAAIDREPRDPADVLACLRDARARSLLLLEDLDDAQWLGPELAIVNPPRWEIGHVAWFQEHWTLRHLRGLPPLRADADSIYDSADVAHDSRWELRLPDRRGTLAYAAEVLAEVARRLEDAPSLDARARYFHLLALFHEDMHGEAFVYTRQTLGYAPPAITAGEPLAGGPCPGDVEVPGGAWTLGADPEPEGEFRFDNELRAHAVEVAPFRIARAPVTQAEFLAFVEDGAYARRELWTDEGWRWRSEARAEHPLHWRRAAAARGCAGATTRGSRSSPIGPRTSSARTRRTRGAAGRDGACRRRRSGSSPPDRRASRGATIRRRASARCSTCAPPSRATSAPTRPATARTACGR
jgi:iron(II)-dependent oxidoreductase